MVVFKRLYLIPGILLLFVLFCTIQDDNGNPAVPQKRTGSDDTSTYIGTPTIFATADSAYVYPGDTLGIRVQVFSDRSGNDTLKPLTSFPVTAQSNKGTIIDDTLLTNSDGRARFRFTSSAAGSIEFTVTANDVQQTVRFEVTETPVKVQKLLQALPGSSILKADGIDTTTIAVSVLNSYRNPIIGECVQFITTAGSIAGVDSSCGNSGQSKTGPDGVARALLTGSNVNDTAFITAYLVSDQSLSDEVEVGFKGLTIAVASSKTNLKTGDTTVITASVINASGSPVGKSPIFFTRNNGNSSCVSIISADSSTNYEGVAILRIRAQSNGSDKITITSAGAMEVVQLNVSTLSLKLEIDKTMLQTTVQDTALVKAIFTNASGKGLADRTIKMTRTFKTENESDTTDILTKKTNSSGEALFTIPALLWEGKMRMSVTGFDNSEGYASADTLLQFITTRVMTIRPPQAIAADGVSKGMVQVFIKNKSGNPIVGDFISFTTTAGTITSQSKTDSTGKAEATLISDRRNIFATVTATLVSDPLKKQTSSIEFKGIELNAAANPPSIRSNGTDSTHILVSLLDAAKIPIMGEHVNISRQQASTTIRIVDSVTNNNGEFSCIVSGTGSGRDTLKVSAAGSTAEVIVNYSSNILIIDTAKGQSCFADSTDSTLINITYLKGDRSTAIPNTSIEVSATVGNMDTIFARLITTDANGKASFYLRNPHFAVTATIAGIAHSSSEITSGTFKLYFKADQVKYIVLTGSPEVIATEGGRAKLEAIAFDKNKNRVKDARLSFNIVNGPSGGEYLDPPVAITGDDGKASTYLIAGKTPSEYQEVWITAGSFSSVKSDTVKFTISGPPNSINIGTNIEKGINPNDGTFILPCAAIVTDVNGNPVADGTDVTFSLLISGYVTHRLVARYNNIYALDTVCGYEVDTTYNILYFEDFNNNFRLDPGEDRNHDDILNRGENINGDRNTSSGKDYWVLGPAFFDINQDGIRQYNRLVPVEPLSPCGNISSHAEFNMNNLWDPIEPLSNSVYMTIYDRLLGRGTFLREHFHPDSLNAQDIADLYSLDSLDAIYSLNAPYDVDYQNNGVCDPSTAVSITKTVPTLNGKAVNQIIYGQSDATHIEVTIKAESKGVVTKSPETIILPIIKDEN